MRRSISRISIGPIPTLVVGQSRHKARGLLLGFAGVPEREITRGIERLARVLDQVRAHYLARG